MSSTDIDTLITRVYQKHRISISRDDPVFQILYLLIEQNLMIEQDKSNAINRQIDEVIAAAAAKLDNHIEAVKIANRETIQELLTNFDQLAALKTDVQNSIPGDNFQNILSNRPIWFYALLLLITSLLSASAVILYLTNITL